MAIRAQDDQEYHDPTHVLLMPSQRWLPKPDEQHACVAAYSDEKPDSTLDQARGAGSFLKMLQAS
jgi:hypothetical protein